MAELFFLARSYWIEAYGLRDMKSKFIVLCSLFCFSCGNMVTRFLEANQSRNETSKSPWKKKRKITINNTGIAQLTDIPIAIFLNSSRIDYNVVQSAGQDVRFFDANGTELPYEIERWSTGGASLLWLKIPVVSANSTTDSIQMWYGNPSANPASAAKSVWSSDYTAVYHMYDGNDSTSNANNALSINNVTFSDTTTQGGRAFFDTSGPIPYLTVPTTGLSASSGTIEALVELRTAPGVSQTRYIFSHTPNGAERIYLAAYDSTRKLYGALSDNMGVAAANTYALNTIAYVSIAYSGCNFTTYFNGAVGSAAACAAAWTITTDAKIGNYGWAPQTLADAWDGYIYDLRMSNVTKSPDYMLAQYRSYSDTYLSFGPEEDN